MAWLQDALTKVLYILAILLFAAGFFPYKPFIVGHNAFSTTGAYSRPQPAYDKVIFMVVDALRSDFVFSAESEFAFVQSLIRAGNALPFTAHASSPTITMPKVKAMTTGSVPSFLDVILNFAESDTTSTLSNVDTWLHQLRNLPGGKLIMYGDDTWLKLFPDFFSRSDGTTSFFVSDFTEVDNNVTRHIEFELKQEDWNGWIMHFLGLDHIGHKSGPKSPYMPAKQREMDSIVRQIYEAINVETHLESTLLVLCGDHGMNDAGNHGGAAPGETSPALVFISPRLQSLGTHLQSPISATSDYAYYQVIEQSDIAPSLCALLGLPIPLNNLGVLIPEILSFWANKTDRFTLVKENMRQMHTILRQTFGDSTFADNVTLNASCADISDNMRQLQCGWKSLLLSQDTEEDLSPFFDYLRVAQKVLGSTASNYDLGKMVLAMFVTATVFAAKTYAILSKTLDNNDIAGFAFETLLTALYGTIMFASSFVEEEHQFWYWVGSLFGIYLFILRPSRFHLSRQSLMSCLFFWTTLRIVRRWNQTGQKFAGSPDIGKTFLTHYPGVLWILFALNQLYLGMQLSTCFLPRLSRTVITLLAASLTILTTMFKISFASADAPELLGKAARLLKLFSTPSSLLFQARLCFGLMIFFIAMLFRTRIARKSRLEQLRTIRYVLIFFMLMQTRINNTLLLAIFEFIAKVLESATYPSALSPIEWALSATILQHISFFALGGTNAISSIDLSNAYNGVSGYNVVAVGFLTFVGNWVGPIYWTVTLLTIPKEAAIIRKSFSKYANALDFFACGSLFATMAACTILRTHLFVWTVFSPKYLYSMAWSLAQNIGVNMLLVYCLIDVTS